MGRNRTKKISFVHQPFSLDFHPSERENVASAREKLTRNSEKLTKTRKLCDFYPFYRVLVVDLMLFLQNLGALSVKTV